MSAKRSEPEARKDKPQAAHSEFEAATVTFNGRAIRSVILSGKPWFVVKDACAALEIADNSSAIRGLDDEEKGQILLPTSSGDQEMNIINESGLYLLGFNSKKPEAVRFRKWVTNDVLPSLRRAAAGEPQASNANGAYIYVSWHGEFHVSFKENGDLSIVSDESRIDQFYLLELEALAHASCLVGKLWGKFQLLEEVAAHTGEGSNTRFQLGQAISQIQHIAVSAMRTRMEMPGGSVTPTA